MRNILLLLIWVVLMSSMSAHAQSGISDPYARRIVPYASDPSTCSAGAVWLNTTSHLFKICLTANSISTVGNAGDVVGPASSTDNAVARFDSTTGKLLQNSIVTIADTTGDMAGVGTLSAQVFSATPSDDAPAGVFRRNNTFQASNILEVQTQANVLLWGVNRLGGMVNGSGKTFNFSNSLTVAGTDGSTLNVGSGGTLGSNAFTSTAYATANATTSYIPYLSSSNTFTDTSITYLGSNVGIGLGSVTPPTMFTVGDTSTSSPRGLMSWQSSTGTDGARLGFRKNRGTFASPTTIVTGDTIGRLVAWPYDGTGWLEMGSIAFESTGIIATNRTPTQIVFKTATNAAPSVLTTALTLGADQKATFAAQLLSPDGSAGAPAYGFTSAAGYGMFLSGASLSFTLNSVNRIDLNIGEIRFRDGLVTIGPNAASPKLYDESNTLALRNSTSAQAFRVYNTYTDASNYERLAITWAANTATLGTSGIGTGSVRNMILTGGARTFGLGTASGQDWGIDSSGSLFTGSDNSPDIGASGTNRPRTGYFGTSLVAPLLNATTGFQVAGAATSGNYLRGNGTNFVSSALTASDISGTTTNDNAAAGKVGEYISSQVTSGSAISLTNATPTNVTSISLTAGDWRCNSQVDYITTGATTTDFKSGTNSTSATFGGQSFTSNMPLISTALSDTFGHVVKPARYSLSGTTTVYLIAQSNFSVGTATAYGDLECTRMR